MGVKNALIIDDDADLDEAIPATLYSAFGFAGQKCSALSRLIVLEGVYDKFVERLIEAAAATPVGDPALPGTIVGPVIDEDARKKILGLIELGKKEAKLAWQGESTAAEGCFVPPTIFTNVKACTRSRARKSSAPSSPSSRSAISMRRSRSPTPPTTRSPAACSPAVRARSSRSNAS